MSADWKDLFQRWGNPSTEARIEIRDYLLRPDQLTTRDIKSYDESAARTIQEMEEAIAALRGYRQALATRYAELSAMAYSLRLDLIRERGWKGPVTYWLRLVRHYEDGHEEKEQEIKYPGNKRREAIKAYRAELKARPGIESKLDIEKSRWEH